MNKTASNTALLTLIVTQIISIFIMTAMGLAINSMKSDLEKKCPVPIMTMQEAVDVLDGHKRDFEK